MVKVVVIGAGVVGASIAYELSAIEDFAVTLIDAQQPAQGATGAALGLLMGAISQKTKGRNWRLRHQSLQRLKTLLPELEQINQQPVRYNHHGLVMLQFDQENLPRWQRLQTIRERQGYALEIWDRSQLKKRLPYIDSDGVWGAIYSPNDGQIDPLHFTQGLIAAAQKRGLSCSFENQVESIQADLEQSVVETVKETYRADWVIITAGMGSNLLGEMVDGSFRLMPVLGQAIAVELPDSLGDKSFQPVITGYDIHVIPQGHHPGRYWIGATVEFPPNQGVLPIADKSLLDGVKNEAYGYCSSLRSAKILFQWQGYRPRPDGRPAPIIELLPRSNKTIIATGHYRNGVLLAPGTALQVKEMMVNHLAS